MSVTSTPRLGLTQWSSGSDPYNRSQLNTSFANLEDRVPGFDQGTVRPAASSALQGYFFFNTTGNALSYCDGTTWWDIVAGDGNFGSPVALTLTSVNASGSQSSAARSDHVHGMPGFGTPSSVGTSNSAGAGDTVARSTHVHAIGTGAINLSAMFAAGVVDAAALATNSVETLKIADLAVTGGKLANGAVTSSKLGVDAVTSSAILDASVTTTKVADSAITNAKISAVDASKVTTGTLADARIPSLAASKITSGEFAAARIPDLSATTITSGTLAIARIPTGTSSSTVALGNHNHNTAYLSINGGTLGGQLNVSHTITATRDGSVAAKFYRTDTSGGIVAFNSDNGGADTQKSFIDAADGDLTLTSDARLKENILDADFHGNDLLRVQIRKFNWRDDPTERVGVVAQEIQKIIPEAVAESRGVLAVKPTQVIWRLVQFVQELEGRLAALESKPTVAP